MWLHCLLENSSQITNLKGCVLYFTNLNSFLISHTVQIIKRRENMKVHVRRRSLSRTFCLFFPLFVFYLFSLFFVLLLFVLFLLFALFPLFSLSPLFLLSAIAILTALPIFSACFALFSHCILFDSYVPSD